MTAIDNIDKMLEEAEKEKKLREKHKNNELHRFCRFIDSYVNEGNPKKESYYFVKDCYQRTRCIIKRWEGGKH